MRLALLTFLTMVAFAANSILNRAAIAHGGIDAASFALIRVVSGAVILCMILTVRRQALPLLRRARVLGALSLSLYIAGFSWAYVSIDAGLGALILFGVVQVSMFAWAALRGSAPSTRQLAGAGIAFGGLVIALWPSTAQASNPLGAAAMVAAGLGWAAYTLSGRSESDALAATAANFVLAAPLLALVLVGPWMQIAPLGIALAILSGAVTSGLGYALWYSVLPRLASSTAAVVQLSVPIIAILGGALLLDEDLRLQVGVATVLVLGGIALAITSAKVPAGRS